MRISLNGADWQFKAFYGEDWRWRDSHKAGSRDTRFWLPGSVPGSVHHDLWQQGEIPSPYEGRNSLLLEWIPARTWLYKKHFIADAAWQGKRIQLHFAGVDYEAEFFLNGESLGSHRGMYSPVRFEVGDLLHYGAENLLAVVIAPAPLEQPQVSRSSLVRTHKSRMTYWWDFCPRMIHVGIWDEVYLSLSEQLRFEDVFVRPQPADDLQSAAIIINSTIDSPPNSPGPATLEITLHQAGVMVAQHSTILHLEAGQQQLSQRLHLDAPQLWYPNGAGGQPLYEAQLRLSLEGQLQDERRVRFGIRQISLLPNEASDPAARPYTLVVNGEKHYIKGWNWVPIDVLYGVPRPQKLRHLFQLLRAAGVNMLRVWGGGLIETEAFYTLADELGIMVWQEFIQSSSGIENTPSDDPAFIAMMEQEAAQIIPRRRNHPSLVMWGGGNELTDADLKPLDERHPLLAVLRACVQHLDPDRLWLPSSPNGPVFGNTLENIARDPAALHDVHGPWEYQGVSGQYTLANASTSLLHSEFGVEGITNRRSLDASIPPDLQQPISLDNPYWFHLGSWWHKSAMWQETFGPIQDTTTLIRATQYMQAEGLRYMVEADRRRKYQNSGTLPWQFNEPYPMATCTSAVDYYGQAKPSYYALAQAYAPLQLSAKFPTAAWAGHSHFEAELWLHNSHVQPYEGLQVGARLVGLSGRVYATWEGAAALPANAAVAVHTLSWALGEVQEAGFFLDLTLQQGGQPLAQNRYLFSTGGNLAPLLAAAPTRISSQQQPTRPDHWTLHLSNSGSSAALWLWLESLRPNGTAEQAYFSRNHFCLLPGESLALSVTWRENAPVNRAIEISGWNFESVVAERNVL